MGGYEAGVYSYLWAKVYAQDMFSRFEQEGILDPRTGPGLPRRDPRAVRDRGAGTPSCGGSWAGR